MGHFLSLAEAVMLKAGERSLDRKSSHGIRAHWVRLTCAAVGSLRLVTVEAGPMTRLGYFSKSGGVNSSTMKGP